MHFFIIKTFNSLILSNIKFTFHSKEKKKEMKKKRKRKRKDITVTETNLQHKICKLCKCYFNLKFYSMKHKYIHIFHNLMLIYIY